MSITKKCIILLVTLLLTANGVSYMALADDDHQERRRNHKRERNHSDHDGEDTLRPVNNSTYKEACSACHFPYQPELLPSGSWAKIIAGLGDHFGEMVDLEPESKKVIAEYLKANAAENSSAELAAKILKSVGSQTPLRITHVPYIQREHHEIRSDVFKRGSIGSPSNCLSCHRSADKGIYDDDYVGIPR
jgi:hypothetical protein